jgi:general secretion pathway protein C
MLDKIMKPYYTIINILLITVAVYFSVNAFYKLGTAQLDHDYLAGTAFKEQSSTEAESLRPLADYDPVIERNLFNTKSGTERPPEPVVFENLQPTSLNLKLLGTVTGDQDKAFAVIRGSQQKQEQLYRIGDTIQSATLKMILREKIILRVNGKDEILEIEKVETKKTRRSAKRSGATNSQNITVKRSKIEGSVKNVNKLMQQARVRPHFTRGKADGLSLTGIKPNSIFHDMGLKSGDIITSVNGDNIESVEDVLKFYKSLQSAESVNLKLKRRGRLKTIDYNIE